MYNQPEIDSVDQHCWRRERSVLQERVKKFCNKNSLTFVADQMTENVVRQSKHTVIVYLRLFDNVNKFSWWCQVNTLCEKLGKRIVVITDNLLEFDNLSSIVFFSYHKLLGVTASYQDQDLTSNPTTLFNCFIQRACPVRQSWFYFLHHHNLLNKGYVSFLLKELISNTTLCGVELFDDIHARNLSHMPQFQESYQELRDQVPYRNFTETNNLIPLILDSKYSLVLETYALEDDCSYWCFTEKSLRSLQFPSVPLFFMQKNGISKLRSIGFEFDCLVDHVDLLPWVGRQKVLLDTLSDDPLITNSSKLTDQCRFNRQLLHSWKKDYYSENFFEEAFSSAVWPHK